MLCDLIWLEDLCKYGDAMAPVTVNNSLVVLRRDEEAVVAILSVNMAALADGALRYWRRNKCM